MGQFDAMDKEARDLFSFMWNEFDPASSLWRTTEVKQLRQALAQITLSGPILDLGCGEGNIARVVFGDKKVEVIGLDDWQEILQQTANSGIYRHLVLADATKMPFESGSFNTVFSNSVIEHIKDLDRLLTEAARILKPEGLFIFTVPSEKFGDSLFFYRLFRKLRLKGLACWYKNKRIDLLQHYHLLSGIQWEDKLKSFSFRVVYMKYYLSRSLLSAWDLTAAFGFILRKAKLCVFIKRLKKLFSPIFLKILEREDSRSDLCEDNSAALLVLATLSSPTPGVNPRCWEGGDRRDG